MSCPLSSSLVLLFIMADWTTFLAQVDTPSAIESVIEAAAKVFTTAGVVKPQQADGILEGDLDFEGVAAPSRALVRRALRSINEVQEAKKASAKAGSPHGDHSAAQTTAAGASAVSPTHSVAVTGMLEVLGTEASAAAVANVMAHGGKDLDVMAALTAKELQDTDYTHQAETAVWQLLQSETEAAARESREAFAYVDLTCKALQPMWSAPEATGGTASWGGEADWGLDPNASSATLGQLGQALKKATAQPRFFRSLAQWTAAFLRYAVAAVAMGHLKWPMVIAHIDVVCRISEECRSSGRSPFLAILYDDLLRRSVATRVQRKDPSIKLSTVFLTDVKPVREAAELRLAQTLQAAGLASQWNRTEPQGASGSSVAAEGALTKQASAAEALQRRAESASRALAAQQEELNRRQAAMKAANSGGKGGGKAGQNENSRKEKRDHRQQEYNNKKYRSGGGSGGRGGGRAGW